MAIKISGNTVVADDKSFNVGNFTTATRPASPETGTLIYNTDISGYEYYNGSSWSGFSAESPFEIVETGGTLLHTLDNPNAYSTSLFDVFGGTSVAVSGNRAIFGVSSEDDAGGASSGKAYIFDVTSGELLYTLHNPNASSTSSGDNFALDVDISGNRAIMGARAEDGLNSNSGAAYIFDVTSGTLLHTLLNPNAYSTDASDEFGRAVAISGNYAAVAAWFEDDPGGTQSGKVYIFDVESGTLLHTIDNPTVYSTSDNDRFGVDIAASGNRVIVGAYFEDDAGGSPGTNSGKAYIFDMATGSLLQTLDNPNAYTFSTNDEFGFRVAISGNHAIVGAYNEDDAGGSSSGKAYIFDVNTGNLLHTLDNPNKYSTSAADWFGYAVSISGNLAMVGAYKEDDSGGADAGKAYIYDVATGSLLLTLDDPNAYGTSASDSFGIVVAVEGSRAIVGSSESDSGGTFSGKAYIFAADNIVKISGINQINSVNGTKLDASTKVFNTAHVGGELINVIDNPNAYITSDGDRFGNSVAISDNRAIVGAYLEDDAGGIQSGKAYIFDVTTGSLLHTLDNPNAYSTSAIDYFGESVAISGNHAIVGAYEEDDAGGTTSGKAYIFDVTTGNLIHTLDNPNAYSTSNGDRFGERVAISGNRAIVGASFEDDASGDNRSGKAYIFDVNTGNLLHTLDNPNAYSTSNADYFGYSVAISGNHAIVGAYLEEDAGGGLSGKAYIFDVESGTLLHTLDNPNAYNTSFGDRFGSSVAISGNHAIVGAFQEDDAGGFESGKAYIFDVTTGSLLHTLDNPNAYGTSAYDEFGEPVAISGNHAIVAAYEEHDAGGFTSGKVYIFDVESGTLLQILSNPNVYSTSASDQFGYSVAISDNYAIVGAWFEDDLSSSNSGKAYIFAARDLTYLDKAATLVS